MNGHDQPATPWGKYADLDSFGTQAQPKHAFALGIDTLPNGDYDCEITHAILDRVNGYRIVRAELRILNAGNRSVEHTYWLNKQESVNGFLAELVALGFPAAQWGAGPGKTPLSVAIPDAVGKLKGIRFRATKSSRPDTRPEKKGVIYHDLHISGRITGAPMPSVSPAPAVQAPVPPTQMAPVMAGSTPDWDANEIPF